MPHQIINESELTNLAQKLKSYTEILEAGPMTHMEPGTSPARPSTQGDRGVAAHQWDAKYAATNNSDGSPKTTTTSKTTSTAGNAQPNPTVTAYQNWLNQNGQKVEVDGHFGDATDTAAKALLADKAKMADPKVLAAWNDFQGKLNAGFKDGSIIRYPGKMGYAQPTPTKTEPANKMTPDEQAARDKAGDMSEPDVVVPQSAPVVNNGPWPAGSPQADAYSKMSPEDQKWLGGADPLDPYILARAPNKGQPATPAQQESVGYDELQRLTSLVHYR